MCYEELILDRKVCHWSGRNSIPGPVSRICFSPTFFHYSLFELRLHVCTYVYIIWNLHSMSLSIAIFFNIFVALPTNYDRH